MALDDFGGSLALTSDDMFHGISQTCGDPAAQAICTIEVRVVNPQRKASPAYGDRPDWASPAAAGPARSISTPATASLRPADSSAPLDLHPLRISRAATTPSRRWPGHRYDYDALEGQWAWQDQVFLTLAWTPDALRYANPSRWRGTAVRCPMACSCISRWRADFRFRPVSATTTSPIPFGTGYGFWNAGVGYALGACAACRPSTLGRPAGLCGCLGLMSQATRHPLSVVWRF